MTDSRVASDPTPRSILVVLPTWVGDFVMATPTLRAIRRRFTDARIVFLMEPNLRDLVRGGDWMDECVEWPDRTRRSFWHRPYRNLVRDLRRRRFDWAVLLPNSFRSALLVRLIGAARRIGYGRDGRGFLLTDRIPVRNRTPRSNRRRFSSRADDSHMSPDLLHPPPPPGKYLPLPIVEYYADLAEYLGCERPGDELELFTTPDCEATLDTKLRDRGVHDTHPLVVLSPGAKYGAAKCWPADRFAAAADRLIEEHSATVVLTCGPGEEPIVRTIASQMTHQPILFDEPRLTLGELKSLIARCDLLIANDAGPRHFAKAFGVPVVTIFGPTHPDWTATSYPAERIVRIHVDCGPCQQRVCPLGHLQCMTGVTVDMVVNAARELLERYVRPERRSVTASTASTQTSS